MMAEHYDPQEDPQAGALVVQENDIVQQTDGALTTLDSYKQRIQRLFGGIVVNTFEIGRLLCEVGEILKHNRLGGIELWVERELTWDRRTAYNYRRVWEVFGPLIKRGELTLTELAELAIPQTGWYELSSDRTPDEARRKLLDRAEAGQQLTLKYIRTTIKTEREKAAQAADTPAPAHAAEQRTALPPTLCLFCRKTNIRIYPLNNENARQGICEECSEKSIMHHEACRRADEG
jgi:hypothetical protein